MNPKKYRRICVKTNLVVAAMLLLGVGSSLSIADPDLSVSPRVEVATSHGDFVIELDRSRAPESVANFLAYVDSGFYDGLVFHRVIPGFMIQGGGYREDLTRKPTRATIPLENRNGLSNRRATVAMARTSDPDSATSQFFINLVDNEFLDGKGSRDGYAVFGKVVAGMETIDRIAEKKTGTVKSMQNVPLEPVVINWIRTTPDAQTAGLGHDPSPSKREPATEVWSDSTSRVADKTPPRIRLNRAIGVADRPRHTVAGQAIDASGVAIVEVNGKSAQLDSAGHFSADILLQPGINSITIVAYDIYENRASETISIERRTINVAADPLATGKYFALLIGVEDYRHDSINDLEQPVDDARRMQTVLLENYIFDAENVTLLENPDRGQVLDAFADFDERISPEDSLLVFYAGHGYWDEDIGQGYWLPSDARRDSKRDWIANSTIQDMIRGIKSKHTLLVSDACFSGGLFRTRSAFSDAPPAARELYRLPSRKAMTSGTLREVPDVSVFIQYLTKRLQENEQRYLSSQQLFTSFRTAVINNSPLNQVPQYGEIRQTGDEGGDFIFVRR